VCSSDLIGFAQLAPRFDNNHLCRVLVDPAKRGRQLGYKLLYLVFEAAQSDAKKYSLFVYDDNVIAINLYRKMGFDSEPHPEGVTNMSGCLFMVK